eukprot:1159142-Pelagomonas_calceolata.AAC.3
MSPAETTKQKMAAEEAVLVVTERECDQLMLIVRARTCVRAEVHACSCAPLCLPVLSCISLVRFAIGIENVGDIWADVEQAFQYV